MAGTPIKKMVSIALFSALMIVGAFIKIPLPYVPVTLQTMFVSLAGLLIGAKAALISMLVYMLIGLVGLPVFTGGGGFAYVLFPTFGFILGFVAGAFVTGLLANKKTNAGFWQLLIASLVGLAVVYVFGVVYFYMIKNLYLSQSVTIWYTLVYCCFIFLPTDILFCVITVVAARQVRPILYKYGWLGKSYAYDSKQSL